MTGVPAYLWQHGCSPTSVGMVVGYYDTHGLPDLVIGDASTQTSEVNAMIASDSDYPFCGQPNSDHFQDYACPIDEQEFLETGNTIPDRSETGGAHEDNCVADFHLTSRSSEGMGYGWSWWSDTPASFVDYCHYANPDYNIEATNYYFYDFSWEDYKAEIDNNLPLNLLVDTDGDAQTDHFVVGIGYDDATMEYGIYDTWDLNVHWYSWRELGTGPWSIMGVTVYRCAIAEGDTLRVPSEFATIQDAIDIAEDGDVVLVEEGTYSGTGFRDISFGIKMIHVVSEKGPESTIIDCQGDWPVLHRAFNIIDNITSFASIRGFTIKGGVSADSASAIYLHNASMRIEDCIITGNFSQSGAAIYCENSSPTISNCTIALNDGIGIYIDAGSGPNIKNTIIWENAPREIVGEVGNEANVTYCNIYGGWAGAASSLLTNPLFIDPYHGNFNVFENSPCIDGGDIAVTDPDGSRADIGIYYPDHPAYFDGGGLIYVATTGNDDTGDGSLGNPYATIRQGLRASRHGDTVIVENGTYYENINFYGHNAFLTSRYYSTENPNDIYATVIDGQGLGTVVKFSGGENAKAAINGFTLQNGNSLNGGGIYCAYSEPTISNDYIIDNTVEQYGGGIYCLYASPVIKGSLLSGNSATGDFGFGGGIYAAFGSPVVINCTSTKNYASTIAGSIYAYGSDIHIMNTVSWANNCIYKPEFFLSGGNPSATYCNVEGGQPGAGNMNSDPMFCDFDNSDYKMNSASPCLYGGMNGSMMGAFGPGCGDPVAVLYVDPLEINPVQACEPGIEEHIILKLKNVGNAMLPIDNISFFETSGSVSGWLGLNNSPSTPLMDYYPDNCFELDVILNMNGVADIPYVPTTLEGYLLISWLGHETRVDVSLEVDGGEFVCSCTPGESNSNPPTDILDIVHLINYQFRECPPGAGGGTCPPPTPYPLCSGDADCNCTLNTLDIVYLINYKFIECSQNGRAGSCPPPCSCEEWVTNCGLPIN